MKISVRNFYSAPYPHIGQQVDLRITERVLEVYRGQQRLSSHLLAPPGAVNVYRTNDADLPDGRQFQEWDAARVRAWAGRIGPAAVMVTNRIFESVPVDEQGLDAALAVLRLTRRYSTARVEHACRIALSRVRSPRYAHLRPILETRQDHPDGTRPGPEPVDEQAGYVRGADYYAGGSR